MFTGIIEEIGVLKEIKKGVKSSMLTIEGSIIFDDLHLGDSVGVNGVCLTVVNLTKDSFCADVMHETLDRSSLGSLPSGTYVNLERAMLASNRFGGHIVSGHIDGVGIISKVIKDENAVWYTITADKRILRYIIEKGSIAVDGISLTVATVTTKDFSISAIPHTVKSTILSHKKVGDFINLENDLVGKYIEKLLVTTKDENPTKGITKEFLNKFGY